MAVFEIAKNEGGSTIGLCGGSSTAFLAAEATEVVIGGMSGDARISQDYDHLFLRILCDVGPGGNTTSGLYMMVNNATSSTNYSETRIVSPGPTTTYKTGENYWRAWGLSAGASSPSMSYGITDCWLINYSDDNTAGCKVILSETGVNYDSTSLDYSSAMLGAGIWNPSTPAGIKQIEIGPLSTTNILAGSSFTLIGVKGA